MQHEFNAKGCGCIIPLLALVGLVALIRLLTGCGASFETEALEKGLTDADIIHDAGTDRLYTGLAGNVGWVDASESGDSHDSSDEAKDSSWGDRTYPDDRATPDATSDTSEVLTCPSSACTFYCAGQGKIDMCQGGECYCL